MIFYVLLFLILIFFIISLLYFLLPSLSPIPFYPTNKRDLTLIVKQLLKETRDKKPRFAKATTGKQLSNVIVDLGAGVGTVIFAAASNATVTTSQTKFKNAQFSPPQRYSQPRRLRILLQSSKIKFIAVEIHPLLVFIMHLRRLLHTNRQNIKILHADIFKMDYNKLLTFNSKLLTIYLYVDPHSLSRLKPKLSKLPKTTRIISYMYEIPEWKVRLKKTIQGVNKIFLYELN